MEYTRELTENELILHAKNLDGMTLDEVLEKYGYNKEYLLNDANKGGLGNFVQQEHFGIDANSDKGPDFYEHGIELKVVPLKRLKNDTLVMKERMVLKIINYLEDYKYSFEESKLYEKMNHMLVMFYEHNKQKGLNRFDKSIYYKIPDQDYATIKSDYNIIMEKIKQGKAHEISEADTMYLSACTKGQGKSSKRRQPFSDIDAKQRAYSFKPSYMNTVYNNESLESIGNLNNNITVEEALTVQLNKFIGKSIEEICEYQNVPMISLNKGLSNRLIHVLLKSEGEVIEFRKANINVKTITTYPRGTANQDMSFEGLKPNEFIKGAKFEESSLYRMFFETKYIFLFLHKLEDNTIIFADWQMWNMPYEDRNEVERLWDTLMDQITNEKVECWSEQQKDKVVTRNNLPKKKDFPVVHVRTKGKNSDDTYIMYEGLEIAKHGYFLSRKYIEREFPEKTRR